MLTYDFHNKIDISVVPTLGSEGTSLSLLEAMASSCAVICTPVGGMSNIVINEFNGIIVNYKSSEIAIAIKKLVNNRNYLNKLGENALKTVEASFSKHKWDSKWINVVNELCK